MSAVGTKEQFRFCKSGTAGDWHERAHKTQRSRMAIKDGRLFFVPIREIFSAPIKARWHLGTEARVAAIFRTPVSIPIARSHLDRMACSI